MGYLIYVFEITTLANCMAKNKTPPYNFILKIEIIKFIEL